MIQKQEEGRQQSIISQTPRARRPRRRAAARLVHQPVDTERDQRQHEEEHDDDYRYHVVFLDHFCGLSLCISFAVVGRSDCLTCEEPSRFGREVK